MKKLWKMYFYSYVSFKWAISYLINSLKKKDKPIHILFCLADHYEPGTGKVNKQVEKERVTELLLKYPKLADQHKDYFGNHPKRTWFFPPHYHRYSNLKHLVSLCENGYGDYTFQDKISSSYQHHHFCHRGYHLFDPCLVCVQGDRGVVPGGLLHTRLTQVSQVYYCSRYPYRQFFPVYPIY